jgi:hypothetical protein
MWTIRAELAAAISQYHLADSLKYVPPPKSLVLDYYILEVHTAAPPFFRARQPLSYSRISTLDRPVDKLDYLKEDVYQEPCFEIVEWG